MTEERKQLVLQAIINEFIQTAQPVGSKTILVSYKFNVSPATIRNDMTMLEKEGYISSPHTSAGRIPTDKAYRLFVDKIADYETERQAALDMIKKIKEEHNISKIREQLYDGVSLLSKATKLASFATTPDNPHTYFLGMSNVLRQPEFQQNSVNACEVFEVMEDDNNFLSTIKSLKADDGVKTYIGEENIIKQIQSCSIIVTKYKKNDFEGHIGILGPKRMNYTFNIVLLQEIKKLLES